MYNRPHRIQIISDSGFVKLMDVCSIADALQWAMDNTSNFENGEIFYIIDFINGITKRYKAQLTMEIIDYV